MTIAESLTSIAESLAAMATGADVPAKPADTPAWVTMAAGHHRALVAGLAEAARTSSGWSSTGTRV